MVKKITAWLLALLMVMSFPSWIFADTESDAYEYEEDYEDIYEEEPAYDEYEEYDEDEGYDEYDVSEEEEIEYSDSEAEDSVSDSEEAVSSDDGNADDADEDTEEEAASGDEAVLDETEAGEEAVPAEDESDPAGEQETEESLDVPVETDGQETEADSVPSGEETAESSDELSDDEQDADQEESSYSSEDSYSTSVEGVPVREPDPVEINIYTTAKGIKQVSQVKAFAEEDIDIYEETSRDSRIVGTLGRNGMCYILSDEGDGWYYVESGKVRGFAPADELVQDEDALAAGSHYKEADITKETSSIELQGMPGFKTDSFRELAIPTVEPLENSAYLYTMTSAQRTVAYKIYGVAEKAVSIYDDADKDALEVGTLPEGGLVYILQRGDNDYLFVESGDARGFISKDDLKYGEDVQEEVEEKGEENYPLASGTVSAQDNKAYYYSLKFIDLRTPSGSVHDSVDELIHSLDGVSLKNISCDEESFAGLICESYGFDAGDSIEDYKSAGEGAELADTGDILIITAKDGPTEMVGIYAGDGEILKSDDGVLKLVPFEDYDIISRRHVIKSTRTLPASKDIREANAPEENYGEYLGSFYLTYYCPCAQCCDVATGLTAIGVIAAEGETIAVDPSVIPYGTKVIVNGHIFTAQDCGGGVKGNHIDIFVPYHEMCNQEIVSGEVYLLK